jgi:hypothetical protein
MSAQRRPEPDDCIFAVRHWKDTLDPSAKWWQRWFHGLVYLPINELALKVFKIPPATSVTIEGPKVTFSWLEDGGYFSSEDEAELACLTDRHSYQRMTYGRAYPADSAQCVGPTIFPRARNPRKRAQPVLAMLIKPRKEDDREREQLARTLTKLNQVLDR